MTNKLTIKTCYKVLTTYVSVSTRIFFSYIRTIYIISLLEKWVHMRTDIYIS